MNSDGFIMLHRKMLEWEWYSDPRTVTVWLYLLLRANWKPSRWKNIEIGRGQTLETYPKIAKATGLSVQSVRTAVFHLKSTGEITTESTGYGTLISITQYGKYQDLPENVNRQINSDINRELTDDQQTINSTRTIITNKQEKQVYINTHTRERPAYAPGYDDVKEFAAVCQSKGWPDVCDEFFDYYDMANWVDKNGRQITNWQAAYRSFSRANMRLKEMDKKKASSKPVVKMPEYMSQVKDSTPASAEMVEKIKRLQEGME